MKLKPKEYDEIDFDSIEASEKAIEIMRTKKCLHDIYSEIYIKMMALRKKYLATSGKVLEIGSGGGFLKDIFPEVITSEVKKMQHVDMIINAEELPFENNSLDAIFAVHVIHHIPDISKFFNEASRVLKKDGGIICVEPYWSPLARFIYKNMHPEPFDTNAASWELDSNNPMTSSNQAMSYLILKRDHKKFQSSFPQFKVIYRKRFGFIRYFATGGLWLKQKFPDFIFPLLKIMEIIITPLMPLFAIHHMFVIKKIK